MYLKNEDDGLKVLRALGASYPNPTHLGYLMITLGFTHGRMQRALWDLAEAGLVVIEGGINAEALIDEAQISATGMALALGMAHGYDDAGHLLASLEEQLLRELRRIRLRGRSGPGDDVPPSPLNALRPAAPVEAALPLPRLAALLARA